MAKKDRKFCQDLRDWVKRWDDCWKYNRDQYYEIQGFVLGDQWRDDEAEVFKTYKKLPMTANHLAPLANHLLGEQRQNTPSLQATPDKHMSEETAEVAAAITTNICEDSHSRTHFQIAFQQASIGGFSALGVKPQYVDDDSFDQELTIYSLKDPCKAYFDLSALSVCKTDGMRAGMRTKMSREMFRALYGKELERKIGNTGSEDNSSLFSDDESITIFDDYQRKYKPETLYQLDTGECLSSKEYNDLKTVDMGGEDVKFYNGEPVVIVKEREVPIYEITYRKIAGDYILEEKEFPSKE